MTLHRNVLPSLTVIEEISRPSSYIFDFKEHHLHERTFALHKNESFFRFDTDSTIILGVQTHGELKFVRTDEYILDGGERKLYVAGKDLFLTNIGYSEDRLKILSGDIYSFSDKPRAARANVAYRRFMHPLNDEQFSISEFQQREVKFTKGFSGHIPLKINDADFYLYICKSKDKKYLIIDSSQPLEINGFQKICFNILLAFAFIKGDLLHNEAFIQAFEDSEMEIPSETSYFSMRTTIKTGQPTFTTNMFWLYRDQLERDDTGKIDEELRSRLYADIYDFPFSTFSKLATLMLNEEKVQRAAILYLHGHIATLEVRLPNYFVAMEALSSYVFAAKEKKIRLNPIKDKKIASNVQKQFIQELEKIKAEKELSEADFNLDILTKNINKLNTPPNADKLSESFPLLDYQLGPEFKKILKDRNSFLHGSFVNYVDDEEAFQKALYTGLRVQFMIAVLILKSVDFEGRIINYPSFWQTMTKHPLDEEYNVKI